jgi:hypothetical protein
MDTYTPTQKHDATIVTSQGGTSPQVYARTAGAFYQTIFVLGLFSEIVVRGSLVDPASAGATAENIAGSEGLFRIGFVADLVMVISDVAVGVLMYVLLRPVSRTLALLAVAFRLLQAAVLGVNLMAHFGAVLVLDGNGPAAGLEIAQRDALVALSLEAHKYGYLVALVFFGLHLLVLGYLLVRATYFPSWLGALLGLAALGYLADSLGYFLLAGYDGTASAVLLAPAIVGEFSMLLWLLVKGVDVPAWRRQVATNRSRTGAVTA